MKNSIKQIIPDIKERYIIIYDLEFTSWEGSLKRKWSGEDEFKEIVQIGAVKVDMSNENKIVQTFEQLVKPKKNPILSHYFTNLTGINQIKLEKEGLAFIEAMGLFEDFIGNCRTLISNGLDMEVIQENCRLNSLKFAFEHIKFIDIRPLFIEALYIDDSELVSSDLPNILNINVNLEKHSALYDAYAIAYALEKLTVNLNI